MKFEADIIGEGSMRFNPPKEWLVEGGGANHQVIGLCELICYLDNQWERATGKNMIEIGSHAGESTFMWGASGFFDKIVAIDPFLMNYAWAIKKLYKQNISYFDTITTIENFSFHVENKFANNTIDFLYVDGEHTTEALRLDLDMYENKVKPGGFIAGHDYSGAWMSVVNLVNERYGEENITVFSDSSWLVKKTS